MKYPTLQEERKLWKKGYKRVACLDEAGRGPLAGPVVAAAVVLQISNDKFLIQKQFQNFKFKKLFKNLKFKAEFRDSGAKRKKKTKSSSHIENLRLRDSKRLSAKQREIFYKILIKHKAIRWGIGRVSEKVIDRINILEATKLAMKRAIEKLKKRPDFLIIDGNFKIDYSHAQKSIVRADEKVFSCALSSIIAKVTRDRIMEKYHKKYSSYSFDRHKGYPTKLHSKMLKKYGPCKIHRKSFKPVIRILKTKNQKLKTKT